MSERKVSTDALETLGFIHTREEKRDAIHLAVIAVEAHEVVRPGARISVSAGGKAWHDDEGAIGIVDPFLTAPVEPGQRFWCVLFPRTITSLRHVWSHPAFPDEEGSAAPPNADSDPVKAATLRILELAADADCSLSRLMSGAAEFIESGEYLHFGVDLDYDWPVDEFWRCYAVVTGRDVPEKKREFFFTCSC